MTDSNPPVASSEPVLKMITADQLADILNISTRTLWRLRSQGQLPPAIRLGGSVRWSRQVVQAWIEQGCPKTNRT